MSRFLPDDPRRRWNRIIAYAGIMFGVWVVTIAVLHLLGAHDDIADDATLMGAVAGITVILLGQLRHSAMLGSKIDRVYEHVNNVEEQERIPDGDGTPAPTLGQVLRAVERKVDDGFTRNDETHDLIAGQVRAVADTVHVNTGRIDRINERIDRLHPDDPPSGQQPSGTLPPVPTKKPRKGST